MAQNFSQTLAGQTMDIDLSRNAGNETIGTLCADIFIIICKMKEQQDLGTPESLRKLLKEYLRIFETNCRAVRVDSAVIESTKYALVALIDETVLSIPGPCAEYWMTSPLQFEFWGDLLAGEKFYDHLDRLLQDPEKNYESIEIFFLCLSLGFSGKFIDAPEGREKIILLVAKTLVKIRRQKMPVKRVNTALPVKSTASFIAPVWVVAAVTLILIGFGWTLACISTDSCSKTTVQEIESSL